MQVKGVNERILDMREFRTYFHEKYLTNWYYESKRKEFHELKLGHKFMEEHVNNFLELLDYMDYIKKERVKIQSFLRSLLISYKDQIKFVDP